MYEPSLIIQSLFDFSEDIRYVAIYQENELSFKQRQQQLVGSSAGETDRFEELLVNPSLLTLARQRGNIDCGGLRFIIIAYGNFHQLIKEVKGGHISICLNKTTDLTHLPDKIFNMLSTKYPDLLK